MRFNLNSDWGQVFVGDTFEFVVTLQNAGADAGGSLPISPNSRRTKLNAPENAPPVKDVVITDELNPVFEIIEASGTGLSVKTDGQKVEATRATLAGGELVTLRIKVRAKPVDVNGKSVLNQASLRYTGTNNTIFSNVVAVKIMERVAPTATPVPTDVPPTATPEPIAPAGGTPPAVTPDLGNELPETSDGTPVAGFVLLGLTLLLHSIRAHRARVRI